MTTRRKTDTEARAERRRHAINAAWARRHPARAAEERALRKSHADAVEGFRHKWHGTVETHAKAARTRQGAVARLHLAGDLSNEQLGAACEIVAAHEAGVRALGIRTISLETRVDLSPAIGAAFFEALGAVRREVAYSRWRAWLRGLGGPTFGVVLAILLDDDGVSVAARRFGMRNERAKRHLRRALDEWSDLIGEAREEIDEASLMAAQAGVL